jgi:hypothetical protein
MTSRRLPELPPPSKIGPPPLGPGVADAPRAWGWSRWCVESSPWLVSFAIHFTALFSLGLITYSVQSGIVSMSLIAYAADGESASPSLTQQPWSVEPDRREGVTPQDTEADVKPVDVSSDAM